MRISSIYMKTKPPDPIKSLNLTKKRIRLQEKKQEKENDWVAGCLFQIGLNCASETFGYEGIQGDKR
jgi:hypothetical protein